MTTDTIYSLNILSNCSILSRERERERNCRKKRDRSRRFHRVCHRCRRESKCVLSRVARREAELLCYERASVSAKASQAAALRLVETAPLAFGRTSTTLANFSSYCFFSSYLMYLIFFVSSKLRFQSHFIGFLYRTYDFYLFAFAQSLRRIFVVIFLSVNQSFTCLFVFTNLWNKSCSFRWPSLFTNFQITYNSLSNFSFNFKIPTTDIFLYIFFHS